MAQGWTHGLLLAGDSAEGGARCLDASHVPAATAKEMVADHKRWHTYRMDKTGQ